VSKSDPLRYRTSRILLVVSIWLICQSSNQESSRFMNISVRNSLAYLPMPELRGTTVWSNTILQGTKLLHSANSACEKLLCCCCRAILQWPCRRTTQHCLIAPQGQHCWHSA
jgi:hypothetical protein